MTIVGTDEIYNREHLIGPFLVHKLLGPRPPPPSSLLMLAWVRRPALAAVAGPSVAAVCPPFHAVLQSDVPTDAGTSFVDVTRPLLPGQRVAAVKRGEVCGCAGRGRCTVIPHFRCGASGVFCCNGHSQAIA